MFSKASGSEDCEDIKDKSAMAEAAEYPVKGKGKQAAFTIGDDEDDDDEAIDYEVHHKKDCPPRFSTLFESKPMPAPIIQHVGQSPRRLKSGIYLPWPAFILLALILFFETIALFAYTAIGLYNNMPKSFITPAHTSTASFNTLPASDQAPVNIAPNFVIGGGEHATVTETVTTTVTMYSTTTFSQTLSATSSAADGFAALASDIRGFLRQPTTSQTIPVVTVTPGGGTFTSVVLVTQTTGVSSADRPTSFMTVFVEPSALAAQQSARSASAESQSASASAPSTSTSSPTPSSSSATPTTSSSSSSEAPASTSAPEEAKGTNGACFGGSGAAMLNCL